MIYSSGFLNLGTMDILRQIILCGGGAVLCTVRWLAVSLAIDASIISPIRDNPKRFHVMSNSGGNGGGVRERN